MRIITLDDNTITVLNDWKERQTELAIYSDYIFSLNKKAPLKSTMSNRFKAAIDKTNCKHISIQELRHSHATYLVIEKNVLMHKLHQD